MAKRARGSVRPGQRRPATRRAAATPASPTTPAAPAAASTSNAGRATGLTEAEAARAAALEAQLLAEERAAETARRRTRDRTPATRDAVSSGGTLALHAEREYAYVGRDLRRIAATGGLLLGILVLLWVVIDIAKLIPIG